PLAHLYGAARGHHVPALERNRSVAATARGTTKLVERERLLAAANPLVLAENSARHPRCGFRPLAARRLQLALQLRAQPGYIGPLRALPLVHITELRQRRFLGALEVGDAAVERLQIALLLHQDAAYYVHLR